LSIYIILYKKLILLLTIDAKKLGIQTQSKKIGPNKITILNLLETLYTPNL
jgi:hypothetical protein